MSPAYQSQMMQQQVNGYVQNVLGNTQNYVNQVGAPPPPPHLPHSPAASVSNLQWAGRGTAHWDRA